jgi:3-hydroxyisobutyrate dehydrogenase-like beta-hydroxyacid dehydrogenase
MGGAMARRLNAAGHELTLWNRTRARAEALHIGEVAATPYEAAQGAEVVISMLTNADAVRSAYLGKGGAALAAGRQVFVEMSTAGTDVTKEIAEVIEAAGGAYVEAPVLGSVPAIEGGTAIVLAAGRNEAIERARPVLEAFGEVRHTGAIGSAAALKLVANAMMIGVTALAAELQAAGTAADLNPDDVFSVITRVAPVLAGRKGGLVDHRYSPVNFALRDATKDLELATDMFRSLGVSAPLTTEAKHLYEQATKSAGELEMSAIASLYEREPATAA